MQPYRRVACSSAPVVVVVVLSRPLLYPRPSYTFSSFFLRPNPLGQASSPRSLPRDLISLPVPPAPFLSCFLSTYLSIPISTLFSIALSVRTLGHVHKAHRSPAFITRYEIAPASSRFTHTPRRTARVRSERDAAAIYIGKLCECRITPDYASPAISSFLMEPPSHGGEGNPRTRSNNAYYSRHSTRDVEQRYKIYTLCLLAKFHL